MKSIAIFVVLLLPVRVARTEPASAPAHPTPAHRTHAQPDAAEAAYREGRRLYDLHEWDAAIERFKEAYRLRSDPASLFNIAQSYRLKGDCRESSSFYKTYRRNFPTASNIAKVDRFIADLEPCAKATGPRQGDPRSGAPKPGDARADDARAGTPRSSNARSGDPKLDARTAAGADQPAAPSMESAATPEPPRPIRRAQIPEPVLRQPSPPGWTAPPRAVDKPGAGRTQRIAALALAGGGVVAIGLGTVFGLQASARSSDVQSGHGVWDPSLETAGTSAETRAELLWALGGAAVVAGGVLYYLGRHDTPHVAVQPRTRGAVVVWSCDL